MNPFKPMQIIIPFLFLLLSGWTVEKARGQSAAPTDEILTARQQGDYDTALALARELVAKNERDALGQACLGVILADLGEDEAEDALGRAIELGYDDVQVLSLVGDSHASRFAALIGTEQEHLATMAHDEARRLYHRWAELEGETSVALGRLAWLAKTSGNGAEAVGMLFAAVAKDPMSDVPHAELWSFLGSELSYDELAGFYLGLALGDDAQDVQVRGWNYRGQVLFNKGTSLKNQADQSENRSERVTGYGNAVRAFKESSPSFASAAAIDPSFAAMAARWRTASLIAVAEVYGTLGDFAATERAAMAARNSLMEENILGSEPFALDVDRISFAMFLASGGALNVSGTQAGSARGMETLREYWKWATEQVADRADWWNNYGFFARESEAYETSYRAYLRSIELEPSNVRYLNDTGLIQLYHLREDLDGARELFRKAVQLGQGRYDEVRDDLALEADMRSAWGDALLNLGLVNIELGQIEEAEQALDQLSELDSTRWDLQVARVDLSIGKGDIESISNTVDSLTASLDQEPSNRFMLEMIQESLTRALEREEDPLIRDLLDRLNTSVENAPDDAH